VQRIRNVIHLFKRRQVFVLRCITFLFFPYSILGCDSAGSGLRTYFTEEIHIDSIHRIILINGPSELNFSGKTPEVIRLQDGSAFLVHQSPLNQPAIRMKNEWYTIFFTGFPILEIDASEPLPFNKRRIKGAIRCRKEEDSTACYYTEIWRRGASSLGYPKPSFRLNIFEDSAYTKKVKGSLVAGDSYKRWILLGLANENLLLNTFIAQSIWKTSGATYFSSITPLPYPFVELFYRGSYQGCYLAVPRPSEKVMAMNKSAKGQVLLKVRTWESVVFAYNLNLPPPKESHQKRHWAGVRELHPQTGEGLAFMEQTYHVVNSGSEREFNLHIEQYFSLSNLVDFFLFTNLLHALDNQGKNILWYRPGANSPYLAYPWDLDMVFGHTSAIGLDTTIRILKDNKLFGRLWCKDAPFYFQDSCKVRWRELRNKAWSNAELWNLFYSTFSLLNRQRIYCREELVNPHFQLNLNWLNYYVYYFKRKLHFMDALFLAEEV
jgi:spore coat protein H